MRNKSRGPTRQVGLIRQMAGKVVRCVELVRRHIDRVSSDLFVFDFVHSGNETL